MAKPDYERLAEDLAVVRAAVEKSNGIFRFLRLSRAMGLVGLWSGVGIIALSCGAYLVDVRYGGLHAAPPAVIWLLYGLGALFVVAVAAGKIVLVMGQAKKTYRNFTVLRLIGEVYTPKTLPILIPSAIAIVGVLTFLFTRGLGRYITPSMSIVLGLVFLVFHNVFCLKSMLYSGTWMIGSGVALLFLAESVHASHGVALTLGIGFVALYVGDRIWEMT